MRSRHVLPMVGHCKKALPDRGKDDEWEFVAPYLALIREDAPEREYDLREAYSALRRIVRSGAP